MKQSLGCYALLFKLVPGLWLCVSSATPAPKACVGQDGRTLLNTASVGYSIWYLCHSRIEHGTSASVLQHVCGAVDKAYTKDVLQRRYLAEDVEELQLMAQPGCNWKNLRYPITTWLVQYSVHQWIARMNDNTGVAPPFDSVFEEYARLRLQRGYPCAGMNLILLARPGSSDLW